MSSILVKENFADMKNDEFLQLVYNSTLSVNRLSDRAYRRRTAAIGRTR